MRAIPTAAIRLFVLLAALLTSGRAAAALLIESDWLRLHERAELRSFGVIAHVPSWEHDGEGPVPEVETHAVEDVRLMLWGDVTPFVSFEFAYVHALDLAPRDGVESFSPATPPSRTDRFLGLEWDLHRSDGLVWEHAFDRLNLTLRLPFWRGFHVTFGRQLASWGYGHIWRPADRFSPWRPVELYREYAPGLDAVQLRLPIGVRSEVRAIFVPGESLADTIALARLELAVGPVDLAATAGDDHERGFFSLGARWSQGRYGLEGEGAYVLDPGGDDYGSAVLDFSVDLPLSTVATVEFAYDGSGAGDPKQYPALWASAAWQEGRRVSVGRWYGALAVESRPHPVIDLLAKAIVQLEDGSALLHLRFGVLVAPEAWVGLGALVALGAGGTSEAPKSEFGLAPYTYTLDIRLYF